MQDFVLGEAGIAGRAETGPDRRRPQHHHAFDASVESAALEARGIAFVDAPISGMEARAIEGTLTVMCGGDARVFDRVRPFLDYIGNKILTWGRRAAASSPS